MEERFKTFTLLMNCINRSIYKLKTAGMAEFKLKSSHVSCLYYLYKEEMTAKELCELCNEDKANISRAVKYLQENGYLVCRSRTRKKYLAPICLTDKGKEVAGGIADKIDRVLESVSEGLSEEERISMYHGLTVVSENLQKICEGFEK